MSVKKQALNAELIQTISSEEEVDRVYKINATSLNIGLIEPSVKKYNKLRCLVLDFNYIQKI